MTDSIFNSKILLFGEYSIIKDSMGLATPFPIFNGVLKLIKDEKRDLEIESLFLHIKDMENSWPDGFEFDLERFEREIFSGLIFDSTIPQGYGVGSSGALSAAIFDRYTSESVKNILKMDHVKLKEIFSLIESHFHGASSGIDPLISFLNKTILIKNSEKIKLVELPKLIFDKGGLFLLDTNRCRRTEPLVNLFLEKCKNDSFSKLCKNVLLPITDGCIKSLINEDYESLYEFFRELSDFQYRHFTPMIPNLYRKVWRSGLKQEDYYLKLCGAGGGGFLLGITRNFELIHELSNEFDVIRLDC